MLWNLEREKPAVVCRKLSKLYKVPYDEFWDEEDKDIAKELHSIIDLHKKNTVMIQDVYQNLSKNNDSDLYFF